MRISSRNKTGGKGYSTVVTQKKVNIALDLPILDLMCSMCASENRNIKRSHLMNMRNLIDALNMELYRNDKEREDRIRFIKKALSIRISEGVSSPTLIAYGARGGLTEDQLQNIILKEISNNELDYINELISQALKRTYLENSIDRGLDILTRYKSSNYRYSEDIVKEYEEFIKEEHARLRATRIERTADTIFTLRNTNDEFSDSVSDIYDRVTNVSRFLYTGMQGFNMIIGGALESTRVYMLFGLAGEGKSMTLLDVALQVKKFNKGYKPKDPTKIPTILYLTQENSVDETVERIFSMITRNQNMKDYSKDEVKNILVNQGGLTLSDDDNINIIVMYKPDSSIDTSDLYTIVEDLDDDGYEVILLLQDHIKRIHSVSHNPDKRLELGEVVNEFKVFAQLKEIPVITVSHLNRDAARTIDENARGNKADLTRLLGRSNVGESMLMIDNCDCAVLMHKEYDYERNSYMAFKSMKLRNALLLRDYICQPYEKDNPIKLMEDFDKFYPVFKESLTEINGNLINSLRQPMAPDQEEINYFRDITEEYNDDVFSTHIGSGYSATPQNIDAMRNNVVINQEPLNIFNMLPIPVPVEFEEEVQPYQSSTKTPLITVFTNAPIYA